MKVLLIDDEPLALNFLEAQLNKVQSNLDIHPFTMFDVHEQRDLLMSADAVLLDIEMPQINGLELAERITEINPDLSVIFITAYNEYAIRAFEMNALDYLMKPVQAERLEKALERIPVPTETSHSKGVLRVQMCTDFQIETAEGQLTPIPWRTAKAQEIFLYLLHYRGKPVPKEEMIDLFWEDILLEKAYSQLYTTIYYIRKNMAIYKKNFELKNVQNGYLLITSNVEIDIREWEKEIMAAPPMHHATIEMHEGIMALYTGGYLELHHYTWAESERYRLEEVWVEHAKKIAEHYEQQSELEQAVHWLDSITKIRPEDEQASFSLMQIYDELNYGLLVHHQFDNLASALSELNISMSPVVTGWFDNWTQERKADNTP